MPHLPQYSANVSPVIIAGLLLAARSALQQFSLPYPSTEQILQATGAKRSRAYEISASLWKLLPELVRDVGRPRKAPAGSSAENTAQISRQVLSFVMKHPGCVSDRSGQRQHYCDTFKRFILELREQSGDIDLTSFAEMTNVPIGTLKDWLRDPPLPGNKASESTDDDNDCTESASATASTGTDQDSNQDSNTTSETKNNKATSAQIETIVAEYRNWKGTFTDFCQHVRHHLRIAFGRTLIANILEQLGERRPQRRQGRLPDEKALRDSFETFFPGAQWTGDGSPIEISINGQSFIFNLELIVDTCTAAVCGASVRDEEDAPAVIEAFNDSIDNTGRPALALLLDLRPSNHCPEVEQGLGDTMKIPATRSRPQNKGHVEGAFGLFQQRVPRLQVNAETTHELARQILKLITITWGRTLNNRPRPHKAAQSRVQQYQSQTPCPQQIARAKRKLTERCRKQRKALETERARNDPVVLETLAQAFERLQLSDPTGNIKASIARYPLDAIVSGIAIFEAKKKAGTLPEDVDGRYLLGIVQNISSKHEGLLVTDILIRERLSARDRLLQPLMGQFVFIVNTLLDPADRLNAAMQHFFDAERHIDRIFWLQRAAELIATYPVTEQPERLRSVARRIHCTFSIPYEKRLDAVHYLSMLVLPLT